MHLNTWTFQNYAYSEKDNRTLYKRNLRESIIYFTILRRTSENFIWKTICPGLYESITQKSRLELGGKKITAHVD